MIRKTKLMRAVTSLCLVIGLCVGLVPAGTAFADAPHQDLEYAARFKSPHVCLLIHSEAYDWPVATAASYFNSVANLDLVVRTEAQGCGSYATFQILHIRDGNFGATNRCNELKGSTFIYRGPYNTYIYGGGNESVTAYINNANPYCRDTATKKANTASKAVGWGLGLRPFSEQVGYPSVIYDSPYSNARVPWATAFDRNGIHYLYSYTFDF